MAKQRTTDLTWRRDALLAMVVELETGGFLRAPDSIYEETMLDQIVERAVARLIEAEVATVAPPERTLARGGQQTGEDKTE